MQPLRDFDLVFSSGLRNLKFSQFSDASDGHLCLGNTAHCTKMTEYLMILPSPPLLERQP